MGKEFIAIFFNDAQDHPTSLEWGEINSFIKVCEDCSFPWAHLIKKKTGEIIYSWSLESTSWCNN